MSDAAADTTMATVPARRVAVRLLVGGAIVAVTWCGILPRLLDWPPVARHVSLMERRGVNPSAMYYTELERLPLRPSWVERVIILWP